MANLYTKTSFTLSATEDELDLLTEAFEASDALAAGIVDFRASEAFLAAFPLSKEGEPLSGLAVALEGTSGCSLNVTLERDSETKLSIYGDENVETWAVGELIRVCCKSALPFGFVYNNDCDRPIADSYNGGYVLVTEEGVTGQNIAAIAEQEIALAADEQPLSDLQTRALKAYDDDGRIAFLLQGMGHKAAMAFSKTQEMGDLLWAFILAETHDASDTSEAASMLRTAARQLEELAAHFDESEA